MRIKARTGKRVRGRERERGGREIWHMDTLCSLASMQPWPRCVWCVMGCDLSLSMTTVWAASSSRVECACARAGHPCLLKFGRDDLLNWIDYSTTIPSVKLPEKVSTRDRLFFRSSDLSALCAASSDFISDPLVRMCQAQPFFLPHASVAAIGCAAFIQH